MYNTRLISFQLMDIYSKDLLVQTLLFQSINVYDKELLI